MPYLTPDSGAFSFRVRRVEIPDELFFVQAVTGALLELTREANWEQHGTMSPEVAALLMGDMLDKYLGDSGVSTTIGEWSDLPDTALDGDTHISTDVGLMSRWFDGDWRHFFGGQPVTLPEPLSVWSWYNQSNATASYSGILTLTNVSGNGFFSALERPAPPAPYTIRALVSTEVESSNNTRTGLFGRDTSNGRVVQFGARYGSGEFGFTVHRFSDVASFHSQIADKRMQDETGLYYLVITDDGDDLIFSRGSTLAGIREIGRYPHTDNFEFDRIGILSGTTSGTNVAKLSLISWEGF